MGKRLRFRDLKAGGIVNNRVTLKNWILKQGFPPGQLTGPNTRTWDEDTEINPWLASRPTASKPEIPLKPGSRRGRPRKERPEAAAEMIRGVARAALPGAAEDTIVIVADLLMEALITQDCASKVACREQEPA
jgi:hypothetical protein